MSGSAWDVVVVGAGPAGSAMATRLSDRGHRVLVLDRERFPRPKPCGDCVSPAGVRELDALGVLPAVRQEVHTTLRGWRVVAGGSQGFRGSFPPACAGLAIGRERLDRVLLDHARARGAEVWTGVRVVQLGRGASGVVEGVVLAGGEEVRAALVVGADGLRSVVSRRLGVVARSPRLRKLALTARIAGVWGADGRGELHVFPHATLGVAPIGGGVANVTVVVGEGEASRVAGARDAYYDDLVARHGEVCGGVRVGEVRATGPFDWPVRSAVADGALLVGDAAGYYDPFTGQGIYRALRGAALAAEVADDALRAGDLSARRLWRYERARRREFAPGERLQRVIEQFTSREGLLRLAVECLRRRPELSDLLVSVTGDLLPVRTLWAPRTLARLIA